MLKQYDPADLFNSDDADKAFAQAGLSKTEVDENGRVWEVFIGDSAQAPSYVTLKVVTLIQGEPFGQWITAQQIVDGSTWRTFSNRTLVSAIHNLIVVAASKIKQG